jgi:hypothetical protein
MPGLTWGGLAPGGLVSGLTPARMVPDEGWGG